MIRIQNADLAFAVEGRGVFLEKGHDLSREIIRDADHIVGVVGPDDFHVVFVESPLGPLGIKRCFFVLFGQGFSTRLVGQVGEIGVDDGLDVWVLRIPLGKRLKIPMASPKK